MVSARLTRIVVVLWAGLFLALLSFSSANAAKQCYDCHKKQQAQFSSRKTVHQPVKEQNCETCHKRHGFANKLILTDETSGLCYSCHQDVKEKFSAGQIHFPVEKGACWECHDPHASDKQALLRTGPEGADDPNACLVCHKDDLASALNGTVSHEPFAKLDCVACHEAHNSLHPALLKSAPDQLCGSCHKIEDRKIQTAHVGKHSENLACTECHSGHSTGFKGLMSETSHAPFASGDCESCHSLPDSSGKVTFAEGVTPGNLCANCHADQADGSKKAFPHAAVEPDNCTNCHSPHSSRYPHLLKQEESRLCAECHGDIVTGDGRTPHLPVISGQCGSCHDVHGSDHKALVKKSDASLCLDCHKEFAAAKESAKSVHAGADDCLQCHHPHQGQTANILRKPADQLCADCHEPDQAMSGLPSQHPPYVLRDCGACHSPHHSDQNHLVRKEGPQLCNQCHPEIVNRTNMKVPHPPATEDCLACHVPHYSKEMNLLSTREKDLCLSCHDSASISLDKAFVHTPAAEGDCAGCHNPHGAMKEKLITGRAQKVIVNGIPLSRTPTITAQMSSLCYTCHESLLEKFRRQGVHKPVELGQCDACHAPHGSDHTAFVKEAPAALCGACHAIDSTLNAKHSGYTLSSANCLDCHNPHISEKPKLVRVNSHPPFEERSCESCHSIGPEGKVQLVGTVSEVCSACHDMSKETGQAHQHPPFEAGECTSCHSAHSSDYPKYLRADANALCVSCHSDVKLLARLPVQHKPFAEGKCMNCHLPHASNYPKLTNKPAESFCLSCHTDLKDKMKDGLVHTPARTGQCVACHLPHAGKEPGLLTRNKQQLCAGCHNLSTAAMTAAHQGFPLANADCQNCHASHVGRKGNKALLLPTMHKPFEGANCDKCHQAGGKRELIAASSRDLCFSCHEQVKSDLQKTVIHAPLKDANGCVACHGPHVGFGKSLQKKEGVQTCLTCHNTPEFTSSNKHQPAFGDCMTCHQPHAGDTKNLLTDANIMELCMTCHEDAPQKHYHPMGDKATDPRTKQPVNCIGCHSPHSSEFKPLLIADKNRKLCILCHGLLDE